MGSPHKLIGYLITKDESVLNRVNDMFPGYYHGQIKDIKDGRIVIPVREWAKEAFTKGELNNLVDKIPEINTYENSGYEYVKAQPAKWIKR